MRLVKVGLILSILVLVSILGNAAEGNKSNIKRSLSSNDGSVPSSSATLAQTSTLPSNKNVGAPQKASSSLSANDEVKEEVNERGENLTVTEEAPSVKGVKKRGSSLNENTNSTNSPQNLFDDEKGFLAGLDYPELQVVPRASERLQMEAQDEKNSLIGSYWPIQLSAIALMMAGVNASGKYKDDNPSSSEKSENLFASQMGVLVGAVWIGGTYYLNHTLSYSRALPDIKKISGKDKKSQLLRERLSEEALERPAKVAKTLTNLSIATNFILATYIATHSKQTRPSYAGIAIGLSFLPLLIENHIVENWEKHQEYKRKIYAPISRIEFNMDPHTQQLYPMLGMQWQF